jgi:hypothetical protein
MRLSTILSRVRHLIDRLQLVRDRVERIRVEVFSEEERPPEPSAVAGSERSQPG